MHEASGATRTSEEEEERLLPAAHFDEHPSAPGEAGPGDRCDREEEEEEEDGPVMAVAAAAASGNTRGEQRAAATDTKGGCCAGCREPIRDKFIFSVIDLFWHQNCVQCCDCSLKLNERCYTYEGKLYCKLDYWRRFGPKCYACREPIERSELVQRIKGNRVYHLKCFTCSDCRRPLRAGEQLHLIDGKRLLCKQDYQQRGLKQAAPCQAQEQQTYYTLLSSQQQQQQQQQQHQQQLGPALEAAGKLAGRLEQNLQNSGGEEEEAPGADEELEESGDESLDNMRRLLQGYDNNNLENEENNSHHQRFHQLHHHHHHHHHLNHSHSHSHSHNLNHANYHHLSHLSHLRAAAAAAAAEEEDEEEAGERKAKCSSAAASKRKRRRKQKHQFNLSAAAAAEGPAKKLASRNGESILNGSILAAAAAGSLQPHPLNKNLSPAASTASSNSSSSSSAASLQAPAAQQQQQQPAGQPHQALHHASHQPGQTLAGSGASSHKPTRVRTVLNEKQLQTLREVYAANPRPDALMKEQLVDRTGLSPRVIRVWFQNKRCKDKKKSILYKQMQQHEKDGRQLAGLTLMRGLPMVAASPVHYDDQSTVSSTPAASAAAAADPPPEPAPSDAQQQQQLYGRQEQPADIQAYQPPWKSLIEYAAARPPTGATPPQQQPAGERLDAASPHYQHLMGQIHGYGGDQLETAEALAAAGYAPQPPTPQLGPLDQAYHHHHQHQHHHQQHPQQQHHLQHHQFQR